MRVSSGVSRSNLCSTASTCFSPKSFVAGITASYSAESSVSEKNGLTRSILFDLLGHRREGRKQFHDYSDNDFVNGSWSSDFGINIQASPYAFDHLEKIDECIMVRIDALGRLLSLARHNGTHMRFEKDTHTASRMARPVNITLSGGNGYSWSIRDMKHPSVSFYVLNR